MGGPQGITVENRYADLLISRFLPNKFTTHATDLVVNEFRGHSHYILANTTLVLLNVRYKNHTIFFENSEFMTSGIYSLVLIASLLE